MQVKNIKIRVVTLVLVAAAGILGLLWLMGEFSWVRGTQLTVWFSHTGNVVEGAPVKLGGIRVGQVDSIRLDIEHRDEFGQPIPVRMQLAISPQIFAALRQDVAVTVSTQGPLGEAYIELYAGSFSQAALRKDQQIRGVDAPKLDLVANRLSVFLESASRVLDEDPQAITKLVGGISSLSNTLDTILRENSSNLSGLTADFAQTAKDLRELSSYGRKTFGAGGSGDLLIEDGAASAKILKETLPTLTKNADVALERIATVTRGLKDDDGTKLRNAIDRMDRIAERGDRLLAKLDAGEGTAGAVLKDPQVYDDLKALIKDLRTHPWKILWKD